MACKPINLDALHHNIMARHYKIEAILALCLSLSSPVITFLINAHPATELGTSNNTHFDPLHTSMNHLKASHTQSAAATMETQQLPTEMECSIINLVATIHLIPNTHSNTLGGLNDVVTTSLTAAPDTAFGFNG